MNELMRQPPLGVPEYLTIFWRRKILIMTLVVVSVVVTMAVSLVLPKYYKSEAMVIVSAPESGGLGAALSASPLAGALAGSFGGLTTPADKIFMVLKSRTVADRVVKRFNLVLIFNESKWDFSTGKWKKPAKPPLFEDAVNYLQKKVTSFKKTREGTISVAVEWKDPKLAAEIANYYFTALAELMKEKSINTIVQVVDYAVPAERKSSPRVMVNMAVAGAISLLIGVIMAVYLETPRQGGRI